ncbi:hypothetical protein ON010_g13919 [Phytophthora cinnamomi]|nr:hypothetical protein ON010_g13919 [Phytophthora cinnamomi]
MRLPPTWCLALLAALSGASSAQKAPIQARSSTVNTLVFKILQLADLHVSGIPTVGCGNSVPPGMAAENCSEALTYQFVDQLVDLEKPDFIAFTGDNVQVYGPSWQQVAIDLVTKAAEDRGIPCWSLGGGRRHRVPDVLLGFRGRCAGEGIPIRVLAVRLDQAEPDRLLPTALGGWAC